MLPSSTRQTVSPVEIHDDRFMFSQSDIDAGNFGVDKSGNTVLVDFAGIGLLPETFVAHTLSSDERLAPIAAALSLSGKSNNSMSRISSVLWMVGSPKLGASA